MDLVTLIPYLENDQRCLYPDTKFISAKKFSEIYLESG